MNPKEKEQSEKERLNNLRYYDLLSTLPASYFHNLAHIVAQTFDTPIALVSFVEEEEVLYLGNSGMPEAEKSERKVSPCSMAVEENQPLVFNDASKEPCLLSNPFVAGDFGLRFYAGAPITTPEGHNIGVDCIIDKEPREFSEKDREVLQEFANVAITEIVERKNLLEHQQVNNH